MSSSDLIQPTLSGGAFLEDVDRARKQTEHDSFHLWWLGQSGYLIQHASHHLLLDPYLSDSLTKKYAGSDTPHVRMTERVVAPERLDFIDVATSTHNHTDHLDSDTLRPLMRASPGMQLIIPEANRSFVADRLDYDPSWPLGLDDGASVSVAGFCLTGVPAAHEELDQDERGQHKALGYVVEFGPWTVYHSGDTIWYDGLTEKLAPWSIDVAILPINGHPPERPVPGNLNGEEAAKLAQEIGARLVMPCHYDMFEFNTVSPDVFTRAAGQLGQPYCVLQAGARWSSDKLH